VTASIQESAQRFGAALAALEDELDWERLGACYCQGDARGFFDAERREALVDVGLQLLDDVAAALGAGGPGRSLYVGAALAELAPILAERLVLGREVVWLNRAGPEVDELTRALVAVADRLGLDLPRPSTAALGSVAPASCDHLWLVSVLSDPEAFPALHDELYQRRGTELGTGRGELALERLQAQELVAALLGCAALPAALTTSDEELGIIVPLARSRGLELEIPPRARLTALVGDAVRVCRLT